MKFQPYHITFQQTYEFLYILNVCVIRMRIPIDLMFICVALIKLYEVDREGEFRGESYVNCLTFSPSSPPPPPKRMKWKENLIEYRENDDWKLNIACEVGGKREEKTGK